LIKKYTKRLPVYFDLKIANFLQRMEDKPPEPQRFQRPWPRNEKIKFAALEHRRLALSTAA